MRGLKPLGGTISQSRCTQMNVGFLDKKPTRVIDGIYIERGCGGSDGTGPESVARVARLHLPRLRGEARMTSRYGASTGFRNYFILPPFPPMPTGPSEYWCTSCKHHKKSLEAWMVARDSSATAGSRKLHLNHHLPLHACAQRCDIQSSGRSSLF